MAFVSWPDTIAELRSSSTFIRKPNLVVWINFDFTTNPGRDCSGMYNDGILNGTTQEIGIEGYGRGFMSSTDYLTISW